jgi:hypothetical protein
MCLSNHGVPLRNPLLCNAFLTLDFPAPIAHKTVQVQQYAGILLYLLLPLAAGLGWSKFAHVDSTDDIQFEFTAMLSFLHPFFSFACCLVYNIPAKLTSMPVRGNAGSPPATFSFGSTIVSAFQISHI